MGSVVETVDALMTTKVFRRDIRHTCNALLFKSKYECQVMRGLSPDISVKCQKCSRGTHHDEIVSFRLKLPRYIPPIPPEPIRCSNLECLARLCDLSLPYMIVDDGGDVEFVCRKCKSVTQMTISGVLEIHP